MTAQFVHLRKLLEVQHQIVVECVANPVMNDLFDRGLLRRFETARFEKGFGYTLTDRGKRLLNEMLLLLSDLPRSVPLQPKRTDRNSPKRSGL